MLHRTSILVAAALAACSASSTPPPASPPPAPERTAPTASAPPTAAASAATPAPSAATAAPAAPARPAGPPPPRYTEVDAYLRSQPQGARCIQGNIINADLTESYVDADLDGDGSPERVFQARDCLVVSRLASSRWEVVAIVPRQVQRDVESVSLRSQQGVVEVTDLRGTNREVARFRWAGGTLAPLQ